MHLAGMIDRVQEPAPPVTIRPGKSTLLTFIPNHRYA